VPLARLLWTGLAVMAALVAALVPAPAQVAAPPIPADRFVVVNGLRLHVVDWGNAGRQPLVLIHGLDRVARTFDPVAAHFTATHHVIAYDMRGHGDSAWDPQGRYLVEDHVADLAALVDQLGLRNIIVWGNSTGGRVAQVFAGMRPDLVARLVAEDVGPERPRSIADAYARRVRQEDAGWASESELAAIVRKANPGMSQTVLDAYVRHGSRRREDGRVIWKRDPNLVKGFVETDLWRFVREIKAPALYVLGGRSTIVTPATQEELKKTLPRVSIVTLDGLGHYPSDEKPADVLSLVDAFLRAP
jgi:pimeloyl-ACP methyl ester carboxylesterase